MHPWHPRVVSAEGTSAAGEWPVSLWHRLLVKHEISLGSRVLVIGCRHPEVVAYLDSCSFDVDGVDDQPDHVAAASQQFPKYNFTFARLDESPPAPAHEIDLVLVHEADLYNQNLLDAHVRLATAQLLACLKPQGQLVFIRRLVGDSEVEAGHAAGCWNRHLAAFPGKTELTLLSDPWFSSSTWNWLRGKCLRGRHLLIQHQVPMKLLSPSDWISFAQRGQGATRSACCASTCAANSNFARKAA
ncbi:MAG: hypothetical protein U0872_06390 [Planctomycetaceae bacterium]